MSVGFLTSTPNATATIPSVKTSALDIDVVAETDDAVAFRVNGKTAEQGRSAVVYFHPLLSRADSAAVLRSVAEKIDSEGDGVVGSTTIGRPDPPCDDHARKTVTIVAGTIGRPPDDEHEEPTP